MVDPFSAPMDVDLAEHLLSAARAAGEASPEGPGGDAFGREASAAIRALSSDRARAYHNATDALSLYVATAAVTSAAGRGDGPSEALRARLVATAKQAVSTAPAGTEGPGLDPSQRLGRLQGEHEDPARADEIRRLRAHERLDDDPFSSFLESLHAWLGFEVMVLAIPLDGAVHHRAFRGVPPGVEDFRVVPRDLTFCTHCVSIGRTFVVEDPAREAFFRGNALVTHLTARCYLGALLRSSNGVNLGTLCGIGATARSIPQSEVALMEHFASLVVAQIERDRDPGRARSLILEAGPRPVLTREGFLPALEAAVRVLHERRGKTGGVGAAGADAVLCVDTPVRVLGQVPDEAIVGELEPGKLAALLPPGSHATAGLGAAPWAGAATATAWLANAGA